jgi:hypothetical protein
MGSCGILFARNPQELGACLTRISRGCAGGSGFCETLAHQHFARAVFASLREIQSGRESQASQAKLTKEGRRLELSSDDDPSNLF